ncbi:MAG: laccase domain-containing protein, partial [Lachnospiraceae bacterium]
MKWNWTRKPGTEKITDQESAGVLMLKFPALEQTGLVKHAFSTRLGGVSEAPFDTMNFTTARGDNPEHVMENYR